MTQFHTKVIFAPEVQVGDEILTHNLHIVKVTKVCLRYSAHMRANFVDIYGKRFLIMGKNDDSYVDDDSYADDYTSYSPFHYVRLLYRN